MAQFDAPAALLILQESGRDIPFLVVSGTIGEELAVAMMKSGAHDYLLKSNLSRLAPAVEREIRDARTRQQRRRAEAELRESQDRLAIAIGATHLGTYDYHVAAGKLVWSDVAKRHFGLPPDAEVTSDIFRSGVHPEDRGRIEEVVRKAARAGDAYYSSEFRTVGIEDRVERWLAVWGRVFFDPQGNFARCSGVTQDITERKQLEEQFRQAQKLESIGRLAGGVAHDFNNLLTIITGYAEMALKDVGEEHPLRDPLVEIAEAAARAGALTRQLLIFSRRQILEPKLIVLNQLVRNFQKMLARLLGEQIELVLSLDAEDGVLMADPGQIEQVILNLAVNARDAMPEGGKLLIETSFIFADEEFSQAHLSVAPGPYLCLAVSDTGTGMTADVRAHIFEPFFTTKDPGKGTGLGLSTVWGIVQQSGGSVRVYSEPGRGTTFKLLFPALNAKLDGCDESPSSPSPSGRDTILVAEDEPGVRKYACRILEKHGYTVLEAANGQKALETAARYAAPIHLLLTDAVMPVMGGAELAAAFSAARPSARILCISGYSDRSWPEAQHGPNYIQKPFTPAALLRQVRAVLDA
jgi:PAS domain S-box-containing protein